MFIYTMYALCIVQACTHAHKQVNHSFAYIRSCMYVYNFIIGIAIRNNNRMHYNNYCLLSLGLTIPTSVSSYREYGTNASAIAIVPQHINSYRVMIANNSY